MQVQPVWTILESAKANPPATMIGANITFSPLRLNAGSGYFISDPGSVSRICAHILNDRLAALDRALLTVDFHNGMKIITWELDLPDRVVVKYPGRHYQTIFRK